MPTTKPHLRAQLMESAEGLLRVYRAAGPEEALAVLGGLQAPAPTRAAWWLHADGTVRAGWPGGPLPRPVMPGAAGSPHLHGEQVVLPLPGPTAGYLVLQLAGPVPVPPAPRDFVALAEAFAQLVERSEALRRITAERDDLRQRAEESEGLHVLGLAANRTLDPGEVLEMVARFARTLLGAHYAVVSTGEAGRLRTAASVGVEGDSLEEDPFAREVFAHGAPLTLGPEEGDRPVAEFEFHARQGMRVGLGVPLTLFGDTFGALMVGYRRENRILPRDVRLALTLAGHAAVAISNARLHRALADRTRQLEQAYQELRWTADAKERFFASMSHELRTPLNAILGYQSLLLDGVMGEMPPELRGFLEGAQRATQGLLLLVDDVLDLSRIAAGGLELARRNTSAVAVVEAAIATVRPLAAEKGLRVELVQPPAAPELFTDPDRMRQILINLLGNAVKFTDRGDVRVEVSRATQGDPRVEVRVIDSGRGIDPADHERIFEEFAQAGSRDGRGTGLGLPISRRLARLLGGDVLVDSDSGRGATFTLWLPESGGP